jgi:hypothetical protein
MERYTQEPGKWPHLLRLWGGDADAVCEAFSLKRNERDDDAHGAIAIWFDTKASRDEFVQRLSRWPNLARDVHRDDGQERGNPHVLTSARVTLEYKGQQYSFIETFGYGYPWSSVEFMWRDGNYACDCNRSLFLQRQCGVQLATLQRREGDARVAG